MRRAAIVAFVIASASAVAHAQPAGDVVLLRDGSWVAGRVTGIVPGTSITIETAQGSRTILWSEVDRIVPGASAPPPAPPPPDPLAAHVTLVDGQVLVGHIAEDEPGKFIILTVDGHRKFIRYEDIADFQRPVGVPAPAGPPDVAPAASPRPPAAPAQSSAEGRSNVHWQIDARAEGQSMTKVYDVAGGGGEQGWGGGLALGAEGSYEESAGAASWLGIGLGVADGLHVTSYHYDRVTPIKYADTRSLREEDDTFMDDDFTIVLGARVGYGALGDRGTWHGARVSVDWAPTFVSFIPGVAVGARTLGNPLGVRVAVDAGRTTPGSKSLMFRATLLVLPYVTDLPTTVQLGLGAVLY